MSPNTLQWPPCEHCLFDNDFLTSRALPPVSSLITCASVNSETFSCFQRRIDHTTCASASH